VVLARLMPNISGPCKPKRRLLSLAVESQLLCAALVWSSSVNASEKTRTNLRRLQRVAALRIIKAYRMVSDEASFVLPGMPPIDLIAAERDRMKVSASQDPLLGHPPLIKSRIRKEEKQNTINEWHRS